MDKNSKYSSVYENNSQPEDSEESWPLASDTENNYYGRDKLKFYNKPLPWIISTVCLLAITILLVAREWRSGNAVVTTRDLSLLEWEGAREFVKTQYVKFNSGLIFNETGNLVRTHNKKEVDWVGTPTEEMDRAWINITSPQDLFATKDEVKNLGTDEYLIPEFGLYQVEFEVFHGLHCLNMIRKVIYIEYYPDIKSPTLMTHVDHCIDTLRQSIMCQSDLTPIPIVWSKNKHRLMPDFENRHFCRDFSLLKEWAKTRDANTPGLREKNAMQLNGTIF